jgi:hypothetical protein
VRLVKEPRISVRMMKKKTEGKENSEKVGKA